LLTLTLLFGWLGIAVALMSQIRAMKGKEMVDSAAKRFPNSEIIADIHADFHRHGASGCVIS